MKRTTIAACVALLAAGACGRPAASQGGGEARSLKQLLREFAAELPDERLEAARAVAKKGPGVVPKLVALLGDHDWRVRRSAADALAELGPDAAPAVPALAKALEDKEAWVRAGAAVALGRIGEAAKPAAPALADAAVDRDMWVRKCALEALARGKVTDDNAILLKAATGAMAIRESGWAVKRFALAILTRHGRDYRPAVPALLSVLEHPPEGMWDGTEAVVELLGGMGAGERAVPYLIKMLDPKRRTVPARAARALGKLGKVARPAIPALRTVARQGMDRGAREAANAAIEQIEGKK